MPRHTSTARNDKKLDCHAVQARAMTNHHKKHKKTTKNTTKKGVKCKYLSD
ncbi:hypothetical protein [Helicobacter sp. T3_23-1056]